MKNLQPEVSAKYALMGIRPGKYNFKNFGEIDLCALTVARADFLVSRGFPHFKLREGFAEPVPKSNLKAKPLGGTSKPIAGSPADIEKLRKNKKLVNKLLTNDWKDLSDQERLLFFNNEAYFSGKKNILSIVSEVDRKMQAIHANLKAIAKDETKIEERGALMDELSQLEEQKLEAFGEIDTWTEPEATASDPDAIAKQAATEALKKQRLIEANENYIYRNEPALKNMPEDTAAQKKKKAGKAAEIERRKKELIELGKPYQRKSRR